jgi:hypothetical protein
MTVSAKVMLGILAVALMFVGYVGRAVQEQLGKSIIRERAMSYGFNEVNNVWNRIRVNEQGYVLCVKE